jgi:ribonuclease HI
LPRPATRGRGLQEEEESTSEQMRGMEVKWLQYTDGSWEPPEDGKGGNPAAGYGVAQFEVGDEATEETYPMAQMVRRRTSGGAWDLLPLDVATRTGSKTVKRYALRNVDSGEVVTDKTRVAYIGAGAHTNNTGELTALHKAIGNAIRRPKGEGREVIWTDSLYAMNITTGRWRPRCARNREIASTVRGLWKRLARERPGEVRIAHVRSHICVPGNELADILAEHGRHGGGMDTSWARRWMTQWFRRVGVGAGNVAQPRGRVVGATGDG